MDLEKIEQLMKAMEQSSLKRLVLKQEGFEIELEKQGIEGAYPPAYYPSFQNPSFTPEPAAQSGEAAASAPSSSYYVTSPMVGTFYSSPSPEDPSFVKPGDHIEEDSVMCIIEAMKVMNEVKSGIKGKVAEILVKSGDPVEFGTKIFRIDLS